MANNKSDFVQKVISEAVEVMTRPRPTAKTAVGSTMYAIKRVTNGYMMSIIPEGGGQGEIAVFTSWDEMIEELRQMMHPMPPAGEGH